MFNLPAFARKRERLEPVQFVPVRRIFKPQFEIRMLQDVNGWHDRKRRLKWSMNAGRTYAIDEDRAREFISKGYAIAVGSLKQPLSDDEIAEHQSQVTRINAGGLSSG